MLGIRDEWAAYQLDIAVRHWGAWVESKLAETDDKGRPVHTLDGLLLDAPASDAEQFAPLPVDVGTLRKVHVKPDGTWDEE